MTDKTLLDMEGLRQELDLTSHRWTAPREVKQAISLTLKRRGASKLTEADLLELYQRAGADYSITAMLLKHPSAGPTLWHRVIALAPASENPEQKHWSFSLASNDRAVADPTVRAWLMASTDMAATLWEPLAHKLDGDEFRTALMNLGRGYYDQAATVLRARPETVAQALSYDDLMALARGWNHQNLSEAVLEVLPGVLARTMPRMSADQRVALLEHSDPRIRTAAIAALGGALPETGTISAKKRSR